MKKYWKSLAHKANHKGFTEQLKREFPSDHANRFEITRRDFFKTMGASMALAGLTSCGYIRKPQQKIYPYVKRPEFLVPGKPIYYATSMAVGDDVNGVLVESLAGRPIKVEGNPLYPISQGSSNAWQQASILNLYDPDRYQKILNKGKDSFFTNLKSWIAELNLSSSQGKGVGLLVDPSPSPTFYDQLKRIKDRFPQIKLYKYSSISNDNIYQGVADISGEYAFPVVDFSKADVIVSLDSDFLGSDTLNLEYSRDFMKRRRPESGRMNRLYQFENSYTVTGGMADHRFKVKRSDIEIILYEILRQVYQKGVNRADGFLISWIEEIILTSVSYFKDKPAYQNIPEIVDDLIAHSNRFSKKRRGRAVLIAGPNQSPLVHSLVFYVNYIIKAPVSYYSHPLLSVGLPFVQKGGGSSLNSLSKDIESQKVKTLFVLGGDPVYNAPADLNFEGLFSKINTVYLGQTPCETGKKSDWVVPEQHYLESWSDLVSVKGDLSLVQPLINPLYSDTLSKHEFLSLLLEEEVNDRDLVKQNHKGLNWKQTLHNGVTRDSRYVNLQRNLTPYNINRFISRNSNKVKKPRKSIEISFDVDYSVYDGSFINNAWLQEIPDPITKLTWDNAVIISNSLAKKNNLKNYDKVNLSAGRFSINGAVWVLPGQDDDTITLKLGYGHRATGKIGDESGFNASKLRTTTNFNYLNKDITIVKTGETYLLASLQDHWSIEDKYFEGEESSNSQNGRPIFREETIDNYKKNPTFAKDQVEVPYLKGYHDKKKDTQDLPMYSENMSIFKEMKFTGEYQWGMAIDLSTCTGCNACTIACQAENNIPVVGKEQVLAGREMHWMRLDRYFDGDVESPRMVHHPINCLQCEQAPCEQVCPVAATVHSSEGLNDMVYNRCIGTRYCSNNCPVKVRRFNYFDYHQRSPHSQKKVSSHIFELFREPKETLQLQFNPDVTVRMRGVMEKCTYCVQRINEVRVTAHNEERKIRDGEIVTACEQACPSGSIVFGDIKNPDSKVSAMKRLDRDYHLLAELNIKPRTSYLASITNPNHKVKGS